ncbi:DNA repair protein Rad50 [Schizosaccharomyces japonicus yFS275]|uniref:DNA repair protein Rad50 n=1 Tax=Schizosaccharomyces japonicus (strain yFS275 / FY16936) TaxID=402676 RepID=B6JYL6_SCHJY|nr:DNA repair protein Rad50 [Schizosaccharomyces japonicus yFS275]EEB06634.2 DNA repair protein Rad50 [Schizosaccharomyces japonicus yFS275]
MKKRMRSWKICPCHYSEKVEGEMEWYQRSENEINSLNSQLQITRQKNSSFLAIVGQARAEVKLHEERLQERDRLMKELKSIYGYDIQSSEGVYEAHSLKIKSLEAEWKSIKQKNEHGISQISSKIENIRAQKSFLMQERQQNKKRMAVFENNINSLKKRLSEFEGNFEDISALEVSIADAETALSSYRSEYVKSDWESKLTAMKQELRELNESYQNTVELVHKAASQANDRAKLSMLRSRKLKLMEQKQSLFDELIAEYTEITREKVTSETIDLASSLKTLSANVDKLTLEEQRVSKESTELNLKLTLAYERNESIAEQLEEFDAQLKSSTGNPDQLSSEIEEIEAQIEEQRKDLHSLQFGVLFYERAIKVSDEKHACQLCRRGLDDSERKEFTKYCNSMVLTIPSKAQDLEKELTQLETTLNQLRSLLPIQERYIALSSDLEKAKKEIAELEDDFSSVSKKHKEKQASLELEKEKLQKLTALSSKMSNVDRMRDEALTTGESIRELETTLSNTGTAETIESLQEKLKDLETQTSQKREEYRVFENAFEDAKKQLVSLESKKSEDSMMLRETKLRLREKQNIQMNLNDNKSNLEEGEIAVQNINKKLSSNDEEMQELDKQLNSLKNEAQDELNCFSEKLRIAREQYTKLQSLMVAIKNDTSADALKTAEENCEQTSSQIKNFEEKIQEKTNERAEFEKKLHNLKDNERNIADNLRYRRLKQQLSQSMSRLQQLKKELQNVDRENFMLNSQNLKEKYGQLNAKRAGFLGECRQLEGQIAHNTRELQIDYKDAKERYRRQLIKTKTLDKANEDLGKYGRALDNAIMQFHSLKMNEVNRIIDEAWKQTYCGTDIDTILIRSDNETKGNRSYNYRVCMVKGDAELDMRGRCSAGQKVLACIIIRLALAECFGINCGILALDEPTTNLDDENICSLAQSLARIVEFRRRQRNFQLIVITHDERFIRLMNTESYCDYYYRVTRDENQNSIILRELIRDHNF